MRIGRLDVCLRVADVRASCRFYESLGFERVEGSPADGWVVLFNEASRIGLFAPAFMGHNSFSLNFRGGDIRLIAGAATEAGYRFEHGPRFLGDTGGSASIRDPDGYLVFFDTSQEEADTYESGD